VSGIAFANSKRYEPPGVAHIPAGATSYSEIHKLINSVWNKEELPEQWKGSITAPIYNNNK
jgi:hypothetical protein